MPAAARWIALSASHGRAEWPERPWKVHVALTLPRQPAWTALAVGSMTRTGVAGVGGGLQDGDGVGGPQPRLAREQPRQRALADRELLAPEEHVAEVDG